MDVEIVLLGIIGRGFIDDIVTIAKTLMRK